jgi:hypothetical protein
VFTSITWTSPLSVPARDNDSATYRPSTRVRTNRSTFPGGVERVRIEQHALGVEVVRGRERHEQRLLERRLALHREEDPLSLAKAHVQGRARGHQLGQPLEELAAARPCVEVRARARVLRRGPRAHLRIARVLEPSVRIDHSNAVVDFLGAALRRACAIAWGRRHDLLRGSQISR